MSETSFVCMMRHGSLRRIAQDDQNSYVWIVIDEGLNATWKVEIRRRCVHQHLSGLAVGEVFQKRT